MFLWLLPMPFLMGVWWLRRRRPALSYSSLSLFAGLPVGKVRVARWGGAALRVLAGVLLVLACAGPRRPDLQTRLPVEGVAIVMTLDISGSMATVDVPWPGVGEPISRLEAAKRAFRIFVAGGEAPDGSRFEPRREDLIGLVTFAAVPQTPCPLTLNHSVLLQVLGAQQPRQGLDAGTNVGDALAEALLRLEAAGDRPKVLILLSDGEHNVFRDGPNAALMPRQAAQLAHTLGVKIYTLDAASDPPPTATPEEQRQRLAGQQILRAIATMTDGQTFPATSGTELLAAYREIDQLEKRPVTSFQYRRYHEYYPWFAAAAGVLFLTAHVLDRTVWRRWP